MLFKNEELNSKKYDFEHTPNVDVDEYSYRNVCNELNTFTQNVFDLLSNNQAIYTTIKRKKDGKFYQINEKSVLADSSFVFNRTADDIYRIIVSKKDFKRNLEKVGFIEPDDSNTTEFAIYLQAVYLFYIMIYFIFPKIKFYDLYDEDKLSSENTLESNTGNEIYEQFIKDAIYQNDEIKKRQVKREKAYNDAIDDYNYAYFGLFEMEYYRFINMPEEGSKEVFENSLNKKTIDSYISHFDELYRKKVWIEPKERQNNNVIDAYIDYINSIQTKAVVSDFMNSIEATEPYFNKLVLKKKDVKIPSEFKEIKVYEDDIYDALDDEKFIEVVMNSKATNTIKDKYYGYDFVDAIDGIWSFERGQIENYDGSSFLFLKKDSDYYMNKFDLAVICFTLKNMDLNVNYISKRTYLNNRSDAQKKDKHSIKRSYKLDDTNDFDASVSSLRDGIFRIICRMIQMKFANGTYDEFVFFECPMNILNNKFMLEIESVKSLESKTLAYRKMANIMNNL